MKENGFQLKSLRRIIQFSFLILVFFILTHIYLFSLRVQERSMELAWREIAHQIQAENYSEAYKLMSNRYRSATTIDEYMESSWVNHGFSDWFVCSVSLVLVKRYNLFSGKAQAIVVRANPGLPLFMMRKYTGRVVEFERDRDGAWRVTGAPHFMMGGDFRRLRK